MISVKKHTSSDGDYSIDEQDEVSIVLDTYDDIFSDFDPSPFVKRSLSDDFIDEVRKRMYNRDGKKKLLKLLLPESQRNETDEKIIAIRLHTCFNNTRDQLVSEVRNTNKKGLLFTFIGILVMLIAGYISFIGSKQFYTHVLFVLFEPAGWFLFWAGLEYLFNSSKERKKDLGFYSDLSDAGIHFFSS